MVRCVKCGLTFSLCPKCQHRLEEYPPDESKYMIRDCYIALNEGQYISWKSNLKDVIIVSSEYFLENTDKIKDCIMKKEQLEN